MVGEQRQHVIVLAEHILDEAVQGPLGADLDEHAGTGVVQGVEPLHELHRRRHLLAQEVEHRLGRGVRRIELAGDVGHQRDARRKYVETSQAGDQRHRGGCHDRGVEGMADRDPDRLHTCRGEGVDRRHDGGRGSAHHGLVVGVDVGDHGVAGGRLDDPLDLGQRPEHGRHRAVVLHRQAGHLVTACAHGLQRGVEGQRTGRDQRAVLAQAVAHHHVGAHAVGGQQATDAGVGGEHRRLGDLGLQQLLFELRHRLRVVAVDEDVRAERAAEQRGHHLVGLTERVGHDRLGRPQPLQHVDVLRALAGVQEGNLRSGPAADEDTLLTDHAVHRGVAAGQRFDGFVELARQVGCIGEVDGEPHGGLADRWIGPGGSRRSTGARLVERPVHLGQQIGVVTPTQHQRATRRGLGGIGDDVGRGGGRCSRARQRRRGEHARRGLVAARHVLFEHDVEVRAAEPEGAHASPADPARRRGPLAQFGVDRERHAVPVDVGVRVVEVEAGRQHLLVQTAHHLEHAGGAGSGLEMADIRLHRTERDAADRRTGSPEHLGQALELGGVADPCRGAVGFDRGDGAGVLSGDLPGALDGEPLTDRVRGRDALALAVARTGDTEDDGVDLVAVTFGVLQPLEHEQRRALTHHETVGAGIERTRAGRREGADLAELDERGDTHVVVDATGDGGVEAMVDETLDGNAQRCETRCTGGVGGEVGAAEVEQVGDPARHHVGQLAGHRVLVDLAVVGEEM